MVWEQGTTLAARKGLIPNVDRINGLLKEREIAVSYLSDRSRGNNRLDAKTTNKMLNGEPISQRSFAKVAAMLECSIGEIVMSEQEISNQGTYEENASDPEDVFFPEDLVARLHGDGRVARPRISSLGKADDFDRTDWDVVYADESGSTQTLSGAFNFVSPYDWSQRESFPMKWATNLEVGRKVTAQALMDNHSVCNSPDFDTPEGNRIYLGDDLASVYRDRKPLFRASKDTTIDDATVDTLTVLDALLDQQIKERYSPLRRDGKTITSFLDKERKRLEFQYIIDRLSDSNLGLVIAEVSTWAVLPYGGYGYAGCRWKRPLLVLVPRGIEELRIFYSTLTILRNTESDDLDFDMGIPF